MNLSNVQLQTVQLPFETTVHLKLLRLDLIDPEISGNKWFKLKKNLQEAQATNKNHIITFGGAYSNHIAATAKLCQLKGIKCTGIIRGEYNLNHTLSLASAQGMELKFVSRSLYRDKVALQDWLSKHYDLQNCLVIPEGGANLAGIEGCKEIVSLIDCTFDYIAVASGTGTTLAGIVQCLAKNQEAIGFSALKGGSFIVNEIEKKLPSNFETNYAISDHYHFGGYAKYTNELLDFIKQFETENAIKLDFVYTAKMMYGLIDLIQKNYFPEKSTIVAIHSGGLQGNLGIGI